MGMCWHATGLTVRQFETEEWSLTTKDGKKIDMLEGAAAPPVAE